MWAKRIGAVALAVALVVGAVVLRRIVDDHSGGSGSSSTDSGPATTTVVCIPELETACRALTSADDSLELTIEPAGTTYDRVVKDPGSAPAVWVTLDPWPAMVSSAVVVGGGEAPFSTGGRAGRLQRPRDGGPQRPDARAGGALRRHRHLEVHRGRSGPAVARPRRAGRMGLSSSRATPTPPNPPRAC